MRHVNGYEKSMHHKFFGLFSCRMDFLSPHFLQQCYNKPFYINGNNYRFLIIQTFVKTFVSLLFLYEGQWRYTFISASTIGVYLHNWRNNTSVLSSLLSKTYFYIIFHRNMDFMINQIPTLSFDINMLNKIIV